MSTVWTRPVPPGITAAELEDALEALTAELGPDKVSRLNLDRTTSRAAL